MHRKVVDLEDYFQDHRKKCFVVIDVNKHKSISDLVQHIKTLFDINGLVCLTEDGVFLPDAESIQLLTLSNGVVKVNPLNKSAIESSILCNKKHVHPANINDYLNGNVKTVKTLEKTTGLKKRMKKKTSTVDEETENFFNTDDTETINAIRKPKKKKSNLSDTGTNCVAHNVKEKEPLNSADLESYFCSNKTSIHKVNDNENAKMKYNYFADEGYTTLDNTDTSHDNVITKKNCKINPVEYFENNNQNDFSQNEIVKNDFQYQQVSSIKSNEKQSNVASCKDELTDDTKVIGKPKVRRRRRVRKRVRKNKKIDNNESGIVRSECVMVEAGVVHYNGDTRNLSTDSNNIEYMEETNQAFDHNDHNDNTQSINETFDDPNEIWFSNLMKIKEKSQHGKPPVYKRTPKSITNGMKFNNSICASFNDAIISTPIEEAVNGGVTLLTVNDVVNFKILILSDDYTPTISDSVVGRVIKISDESVKLKIMSGKEICIPLQGKFSLPSNDSSEEENYGKSSDIIELFIKDMINVVKITVRTADTRNIKMD